MTASGGRNRIERALHLVDDLIVPQGATGAAAAVWWRGEIVAERYIGNSSPNRPVEPQTLFPLASVTKPFAAATIVSLVDQGLLSLDEPVSRIVPEFRGEAGRDAAGVDPELERLRRWITPRQLLCHVSGLPEDLDPQASGYQEMVPLDAIIDAMCRLPLQHAPGTEVRYSNAGFGVLTRLAERVSELPFWELARERVFAPLALHDIVVNPTGEALARVAHLADTDYAGTEIETYNSAYWRELGFPWGGLFGTPRDAARFAGAFLPSGESLLSRAAVSLMTTDQTLGVPGGVESARVRWEHGRWGLGWEVKGEKRGHWTGELTSSATFCHFGRAGTLLWGDLERDLALAVFANRSVARMWSFILTRWARISNAVVAAATR